jgi:protein-disulfide isomerase
MRLNNMKLTRSLALLALSSTLASAPVLAQRAAPPGSGDPLKDSSAFHPPAGAKVAVLEWQDLTCPACAHAFPIVHQAVAHYKIPLVEHDFLLGGEHAVFGDKEAAVWARYLQDKVSPEIADQYRGAVFAAQSGITSRDDMQAFTRRFFATHGLKLPFVPDPTGELLKEVMADRALGEKAGLQHTPMIIVCTQHEWVQVTDTQYLYQTIDELLAHAGGASSGAKPASAKPAGAKPASAGAKPAAAKKAAH